MRCIVDSVICRYEHAALRWVFEILPLYHPFSTLCLYLQWAYYKGKLMLPLPSSVGLRHNPNLSSDMFSKKLLSLALLATLLAVGSASHTRPYRRQDTTSAGTCSNTGSGSGTSSTNSGSGSGTNSTNSGTGTQSNTQPALPSGCTRNATVQAGDTCDIFSARNDVSTYACPL